MTDQARIAALAESYRAADTAMRELPIYNSALSVETFGFDSRIGDNWLGILITPWFMNLILLPSQVLVIDETRYGQSRKVQLPAGEHIFRYAGDDMIGEIWTSSLHSPMDVFKSQEQARAEARLRLCEALTPPEDKPAPSGCVSRRAFFSTAAGQRA